MGLNLNFRQGKLIQTSVAALLLAAAAGTATAQVAFEQVPSILPGDSSWAFGVSSDGTWVVGRSGTNYYYGSSGHGYRWSHSSGTEDLDPLVGESTGYGVSADGNLVVGYENAGSRGWRSFTWTPTGGMNHIYNDGMLMAASSDGAFCVGYESTTSGLRALRCTMTSHHPAPVFIDAAGVTSSSQSFGTSADGSVVVGVAYFTGIGQRAFRWTEPTGMVNIGAAAGTFGTPSQASGVSSDGNIVVGTENDLNSPYHTHAFRWTAATGMAALPALDSTFTYVVASGISADGSTIVGKSHSDTNYTNTGFMYRATVGVQRLDTVLAAVLPAGWHITEANATSANGQVIVGTVQEGLFGALHSFKASVGTSVPPSVLSQPGAIHVNHAHQTVTLSSPVGGFAPFTFQWQIADGAGGWNNVADIAGHISGSSAANLVITDATSADNGTYRCSITNISGSTTSDAADLSVCVSDFNNDSVLDFFDYLDFVDAFSTNSASADFNSDGSIDFFDYLDFVDSYSAGC